MISLNFNYLRRIYFYKSPQNERTSNTGWIGEHLPCKKRKLTHIHSGKRKSKAIFSEFGHKEVKKAKKLELKGRETEICSVTDTGNHSFFKLNWKSYTNPNCPFQYFQSAALGEALITRGMYTGKHAKF